MKKIIFLTIYTIFYFGCQEVSKPKPFSGDKQFRTTEPSKLFFNNVRSGYYYRTRKPNTKMDIYKIRKFSMTDKRPIMYPMIVNNWLEDEAYLFLEKNAYNSFIEPIQIRNAQDSLAQTFEITVFNKKNQYEFARKIYTNLKEGNLLEIKTKNNTFVPIFQNYEDKSNFMMTMRDYYRLIELQ